jgi:hypothetical protein
VNLPCMMTHMDTGNRDWGQVIPLPTHSPLVNPSLLRGTSQVMTKRASEGQKYSDVPKQSYDQVTPYPKRPCWVHDHHKVTRSQALPSGSYSTKRAHGTYELVRCTPFLGEAYDHIHNHQKCLHWGLTHTQGLYDS